MMKEEIPGITGCTKKYLQESRERIIAGVRMM